MQETFIFLVLFVAINFMASNLLGRGSDHIFRPYPGFALLFSLYYIFGAISVSGTFDVSSLPVERLWPVFIANLVAFSLFAHPLLQGGVDSLLYKNKLRAFAPDPSYGSEYYYKTFNMKIVAIFWMLSLGVTLSLWAKSGVPVFSSNVDAARMAVASNGYLGTIAASIDVTALFSAIFLISSKGRHKDWRFYFCLIIIVSFVFVAVLSGSRSRIFKLIIPVATAYHFTRKPIPVKLVIAALPIGALLIGFLGYFRAISRWGDYTQQGLPSWVGTDICSQVLYFFQVELGTAIYGLCTVLKLFPDNAPYTFGWLHIGPFLAPFQAKIPIPGNYFKELIGGTWDGVGLAATFIAPQYAEFGLIGVLFFSSVYGFFISRMYRRTLFESDFRFYRVGTYSMFFYFMLSAIRSDFISFDVIWFMTLCAIFRIFRMRPRARIGMGLHGDAS